ncbi:MAG TPA: hypothetical protein ENH85_09785 [Candidatus Scalindua sp.]|nr:hypothetical protein [Candidatus Scalindua sp.]
MDWIQDFTNKFSHYNELQYLKRTRFHGSVIINFSDGMPHNCERRMHMVAKKDKPIEVQP